MRIAPGPCGGDEQKPEALMEAWGTQVKRLCGLYRRDMHLAGDASQETFVKAWRSLGHFSGECSGRT